MDNWGDTMQVIFSSLCCKVFWCPLCIRETASIVPTGFFRSFLQIKPSAITGDLHEVTIQPQGANLHNTKGIGEYVLCIVSLWVDLPRGGMI